MISLEIARQLKEAGLMWVPALHDFFAIPDRGMDDRIFVISDLLVTIEMLKGMKVVSFQGASEWALDYLVASEAIWMPSEEQLREALITILITRGKPFILLRSGLGEYQCKITVNDQLMEFTGKEASEAYGAALLHVLTQT